MGTADADDDRPERLPKSGTRTLTSLQALYAIEAVAGMDDEEIRSVGSCPESFPPQKVIADAKEGVDPESHLAVPRLLVSKTETGYRSGLNPELERMITSMLTPLERRLGQSPYEADAARERTLISLFMKRLFAERDKRGEVQMKVTDRLCQVQSRYMERYNPGMIEEFYKKDIAQELGINVPELSRMTANLTARLPDGRVIFAADLAPGKTTKKIKTMGIMLRLMKSKRFYGEMGWEGGSAFLTEYFRDIHGIEMNPRSMKYCMVGARALPVLERLREEGELYRDGRWLESPGYIRGILAGEGIRIEEPHLAASMKRMNFYFGAARTRDAR